MDRQSCKDCQAAFGAHNQQWAFEKKVVKEKKDPPCATCQPLIMVENSEAINIYSACSDQWIMDQGRPIGMMIPAIESTMRIFKVVDRVDCLRKVQFISRQVADLLGEKIKKQLEGSPGA